MLVLSRHKDQTITIGDDITIVVVDIRGDKVRLGIEAPNGVAVHRLEVFNAIQREHGHLPERESGSPPRHPGYHWWRELETDEWSMLNLGEHHIDDKWIAKTGGFWGPRVTPPQRQNA